MLNQTIFEHYEFSEDLGENDLFALFAGKYIETQQSVMGVIFKSVLTTAGDFISDLEPLFTAMPQFHILKYGEIGGQVVIVWEQTSPPTAWDNLIGQCLHPDPNRRIQSAAEFLNKLKEIQNETRVGKGKSVIGMEDSLIGQTLGAYRLIERLGQGGMATVYKAYEAALDRYVAIKVLPQLLASDPTFMHRFRREAKAIAQLDHPNIVPIFSYGEESGITYIAMQFIRGGTLKHSSKAYDTDDALRLLLPIARALGYAHKRGIVHRDIKPSNVLISDDGRPILADFGLAQMTDTSIKLTQSGVGMGTPTYMSPEQGQGDPVDHRTDIYSFGIMLYELVTGEAPFRADTPMAVVIKHLTAPMPMPRQVNPAIPEEVEALILKATAKNPDDRFQSAEEMVLTMERALDHMPTHVVEKPSENMTFKKVEPVPAMQEPVTPLPTKVSVAPPKSKSILKTFAIAALLIIGVPCLGVVLMFVFDLCPPQGPWTQPPWCPGTTYVVPFINTPSPLNVAPLIPVMTDGKIGNILFQDDFDGNISPRWMFTASPYLVPWTVEKVDGRTVLHSWPPNPPGETSDAEIRDTQWKDYAIQFDFHFIKPDQFGEHYFLLRGRVNNCPPTIRSIQMYEVTVSPDTNFLIKAYCKEGSHQQIAQSDVNFEVADWHTLQYIFVGNRIRLFIDGKPYIDYTDNENWIQGGDLWLETGAGAEMLFDNLKVYEIVP